MLREHGAQRPSVFELLTVVHGIRGTKSPFQYTVPPPPPIPPPIKCASQIRTSITVETAFVVITACQACQCRYPGSRKGFGGHCPYAERPAFSFQELQTF